MNMIQTELIDWAKNLNIPKENSMLVNQIM